MKLLIPLFALLVSVSANASHFVTCDIKAKVVGLQKIDRLNDTTVERRTYKKEQGKSIDETITIATIRLDEISNNKGMLNCQYKKSDLIDLYVKKREKKKYKIGTELNLVYRNIGDALGSSITWDVQ